MSVSENVGSISTNLFIGGEWVSGGRTTRIPVYNPANGTVIDQVADAGPDDAIAAIDAAAHAASAWAATAPRVRGEILRRCFELITRDADRLARLISLENGKALKDAKGEVIYAAEFFRWFAEEAVRINGSLGTSPSGTNRILVQYEPVGVSLLITPWNFPAAMATRKIGPALAAGCTCILKPATETPLTAYAIGGLCAEAGVPPGVINIITSSSTGQVVDAMLSDPRVRKLSFTGSTEVGKVLLRKASEQIIKCSMELGGNAPFIVFEDADIDKAIVGAMIAKMRNGGEACTAANRFYVHRDIAETFGKRLVNEMSKLTVGDLTDDEVDCGPLINVAAVNKVEELIQDAVQRSAKVLCGGRRLDRPGHFFAPTVLIDVPPDADMANEEIFGPVAPIYVFEQENEVIRMANETEYGLVSYVYTGDIQRGLRVAGQLEAGMVALNRGLVSDPSAPFGGVKQSGLGREGGDQGILEFLESKYIAVDW